MDHRDQHGGKGPLQDSDLSQQHREEVRSSDEQAHKPLRIAVKDAALLRIQTEGGDAFGGTQEWYPTRWQRMSGCGATVASNMVWYMTLARHANLAEVGQRRKADFVRLMQGMFACVTPGMGGVNKSSIFIDGVEKYSNARGTSLIFDVIEIPKQAALRPNIYQVLEFIASALAKDMPVAFLNLHNGNVKNLDSWHWVTLLELDCEAKVATISDQGKALPIDMGAWLARTKRGGALVSFASR